MAKALLLNTLTGILGDYIQDLNHDNLEVGIFGGQLELNDLSLNPKAINELQLPVSIRYGRIGSFSASIPWLALTKEPVTVTVADVTLLVAPVDHANINQDQAKKRRVNIKRNQLKEAEKDFREKIKQRQKGKDNTPKEEEKLPGWLKGLLSKIADNIQVTVSNVHIRYEDSVSDPGKLISVGLTFSWLGLKNTDSQWNELPSKRSQNNKTPRRRSVDKKGIVYKVGTLEYLAVYFNIDDKQENKSQLDIANLSNDVQIQDRMKSLIARDNVGIVDAVQSVKNKPATAEELGEHKEDSLPFIAEQSLLTYVLEPVYLTVRIVRNTDPPPRQLGRLSASRAAVAPAGLDVRLDGGQQGGEWSGGCLSLNVCLSAEQLRSLMHIQKQLEMLGQKQAVAALRPSCTPKEDPRAWFWYGFRATRLISGGSEVPTLHSTVKALQSKKRYMELYKKSKRIGGYAPISKEEQEELDQLIDQYPIQSMLIFNYQAEAEVKEVPWWNALTNPDSQDKQHDDLGMSDVLFDHYQTSSSTTKKREKRKNKTQKVHKDYVLYRIQLRFDIRAILTERGQEMLRTTLALQANAEVKPDMVISACIGLDEVLVQDMLAQDGSYKEIFGAAGEGYIGLQDSTRLHTSHGQFGIPESLTWEGQDRLHFMRCPLQICLHTAKDSLCVSVILDQLQAVYKQECVEQLIEVFVDPVYLKRPTHGKEPSKEQEIRDTARPPFENIMVSFSCAAPNFALPFDSTTLRCMYLDLGHLTLEGEMKFDNMTDVKPKQDMLDLKASLKDINVQLIGSHGCNTQWQRHIISPFGISVSMMKKLETQKRILQFQPVREDISASGISVNLLMDENIHLKVSEKELHEVATRITEVLYGFGNALAADEYFRVAGADTSRHFIQPLDASNGTLNNRSTKSCSQKGLENAFLPRNETDENTSRMVVKKTTPVQLDLKIQSFQATLQTEVLVEHASIFNDAFSLECGSICATCSVRGGNSSLELKLDYLHLKEKGMPPEYETIFAAGVDGNSGPKLLDLNVLMTSLLTKNGKTVRSTLEAEARVGPVVLSLRPRTLAGLAAYPAGALRPFAAARRGNGRGGVRRQPAAAAPAAARPARAATPENDGDGSLFVPGSAKDAVLPVKNNEERSLFDLQVKLSLRKFEVNISEDGLPPTGKSNWIAVGFVTDFGIDLTRKNDDVVGRIVLGDLHIKDLIDSHKSYQIQKLLERTEGEGSEGPAIELLLKGEKGKLSVECTIECLRANIILETILRGVAVVAKSFKNFEPVLRELDALQRPSAIEPGEGAFQMKSELQKYAPESNQQDLCEVFELRIKAKSPTLRLIDDASDAQTKALVLQSEVNVCIISKNWPDIQHDSVSIQLYDLSSHLLLDLTHKAAFQIVDKWSSSFVFVMTGQFDEQTHVVVPVDVNIQLTCSPLRIRLSYWDASLVMNIINDGLKSAAEAGESPTDLTQSQDAASTFTEELGTNGYLYEKLSLNAKILVDKIQLMLIDDVHGQDNPVLRILISGFSFDMKDNTGTGVIGLNVDYYNIEVTTWEPLVETWQVKTAVLFNPTGKSTVEVLAESSLNINLTSEFLDNIMSSLSLVSWSDKEAEAIRGHRHDAVFTVLNATGIPLYLNKDNKKSLDNAQMISPGKAAALAFTAEHDFFFEEKAERLVCVMAEDTSGSSNTTRACFPGLSLSHIGTNSFLFDPFSPEARSEINTLVVVEEIWQYSVYERGEWVPGTGTRDKHEWMDKNFCYRKTKFDVQEEMEDLNRVEQKWVWVDEWHVDDLHLEDGWEYAKSLANIVQGQEVSGSCQKVHKVRRRRHVRGRVLRSYLFQPRLVWQVLSAQVAVGATVRTRKRTQGLLRASPEVINCTGHPLEVQVALPEAGEGWRPAGVVRPNGGRLFVGVEAARLPGYRFRPLPDPLAGAYPLPSSLLSEAEVLVKNSSNNQDPRGSWSDMVYAPHLEYADGRMKQIRCQDNAGRTFYLLVHLAVNSNTITLTITAHFELTNMLPCALTFKLFSNDAVSEYGYISTAQSRQLVSACDSFEFEPKLVVQFGNYNQSDLVCIATTGPKSPPKNIPIWLAGAAAGAPPLCLEARVARARRGGCVRVRLSAPYWVADLTGLGLRARPPAPGPPPAVEKEEEEEEAAAAARAWAAPGLRAVVQLLDFESHTDQGCRMMRFMQKETPVYHDSEDIVWTEAPLQFQDQVYIQCSSQDLGQIEGLLMTVTVAESCQVIVLLPRDDLSESNDTHHAPLPKWMVDANYQCARELIFTAQENSTLTEFSFAAFTKDYPAGESVIRLGAIPPGSYNRMYAVLLIPGANSTSGKDYSLMPDLTTGNDSPHSCPFSRADVLNNAWGIGHIGAQKLRLYSSEKKKISVGVKNPETDGAVIWSKDLKIGPNQQQDFSIRTEAYEYELQVASKICPGDFSSSTVVEFTPRYMIANATAFDLEIYQDDVNKQGLCKIKPGFAQPLYLKSKKAPSRLKITATSEDPLDHNQIKYESAGCIEMKEMGQTSLILYEQSGDLTLDQLEEEWRSNIIVNVEVRDAKEEEHCSVIIILWQTTSINQQLYRIQNDCSTAIIVHQKGSSRNLSVRIEASERCEYGWAYPLKSHEVHVSLICQECNTKVDATLSMQEYNTQTNIHSKGKHAISSLVEVVGNTTVMKLSLHQSKNKKLDLKTAAQMIAVLSSQQRAAHSWGFSAMIQLQSSTISLISNQPNRREICLLSIIDIYCDAALSTDQTDLEVQIGHIQADNFAENRVCDVLIAPAFQNQDGEDSESSPMLNLSIIKYNTGMHFKQISVRLGEVAAAADAASAAALLRFLAPLAAAAGTSAGQALAAREPRLWAHWITNKYLSQNQNRVVPLESIFSGPVSQAVGQRMYFELIEIGQLQLYLSYLHDIVEVEREAAGHALISLINQLPTVQSAGLSAPAYKKTNIMPSADGLASNLSRFYAKKLSTQILQLAGSLFGVPNALPLLNCVANGIVNAVAEPAAASFLGSSAFAVGAVRGGRALTASAARGLAGALSQQLTWLAETGARLTLDSAYRRRRARQRRWRAAGGAPPASASPAAGAGGPAPALGGLDSLVFGVAQGLWGVIGEPWQEWKSQGAIGAGIGLAKGTFGLPLKSVVGVFDALLDIGQGIARNIGLGTGLAQLRIRRALTPLPNKNCMVLEMFSLEESQAQSYLDEHGLGHGDVYAGFFKFHSCTLVAGARRGLLVLWATARLHRAVAWRELRRAELEGKDLACLTLIDGSKVRLKDVQNPGQLANLFSLLISYRGKMDNFEMPENYLLTMKQTCEINEQQRTVDAGYQWGQVHNFVVLPKNSARNVSEEDKLHNETLVLQKVERDLKQCSTADAGGLDAATWSLAHAWRVREAARRRRRRRQIPIPFCHQDGTERWAVVALVVNHSGYPLQDLRSSCKEHIVIPGKDYDQIKKSIGPGGTAIVFGIEHHDGSSYENGAHYATIQIHCSFFNLVVSANPSKGLKFLEISQSKNPNSSKKMVSVVSDEKATQSELCLSDSSKLCCLLKIEGHFLETCVVDKMYGKELTKLVIQIKSVDVEEGHVFA